MKLYISVVSHDHGNIISELDVLGPLSEYFTVVIKSNTDDKKLLNYCFKYPKIILINMSYGLGFGENNNFVYKYCAQSLNIELQDYFLILNPDVYFSVNQCELLVDNIRSYNHDFITINLFKDYDKKVHDNSIRRFPNLLILMRKFFRLETDYNIDKKIIKSPMTVDWAAGSFLCIKSDIYADLNGFDEQYFMYYEDVDLCYRAKSNGINLIYLPFIHAIHLGAFKNRKIFSRHNYWYIKSVLRFLIISYLSNK